MGKSAVSSTIRPVTTTTASPTATASNTNSNIPTVVSPNQNRQGTNRNQQSRRLDPSDDVNNRNILFNTSRQDSITSLLNTYNNSSSTRKTTPPTSSYTLNNIKRELSKPSVSGPPPSNYSTGYSNPQLSDISPTYLTRRETVPTMNDTQQQSINPNSTTTGQQYHQHSPQQQQPPQFSQQFSPQSQQQFAANQPIRPRGDSIFLPPPITSQVRSQNELYEQQQQQQQQQAQQQQQPNAFPSRSNSIFSSLINIPGSNGNSISEQSSSSGIKSEFKPGSSSSAPSLPPTRSRQMSLIPNSDFSMEDLENLLNKESVGNLISWQQQDGSNRLSLSGAGAGGKGKGQGSNALDLSTWDNQNSLSAIPGYTGSVSEFLQGMISNGSIDLNSMSHERRDSILKIINDQQSLRSQRSEDPKGKVSFAKLREDIFDKRKQQQQQQAQQQQQRQQQQQQQRAQQNKSQQKDTRSKRKLEKETDISPTSSIESTGHKYDESHSPKTSPAHFNPNLNRTQQPFNDLYQQSLPQLPMAPTRLFSNYPGPNQIPPPPPPPHSQPVALSPSNQYQYTTTSYPNYVGYTYPGSRGNSISGNYVYPMQYQNQTQFPGQPPPQQQPQQVMQQQQQQQQQQMGKSPAYATIPPGATTKSTRSSRGRKSQQQQDMRIASPPKPLSSSPRDRNLVPAQQFAKSEDGRPLLGATKIDQLMLVIQARDKGVTKAIQQAPDGSILAPAPGIQAEEADVLPAAVSLVGGVDKPHKKLDDDMDNEEGYIGHGGEDDDDEEGVDHEHHKHRRTRHKNQQCQYCFKYFTQSTHLEVHIRSHIGYKPFECNYCHKKFTQGGNLRTHLRLHTGEKPFTCEVCHRSFSRKGNLAAHKLTHENLKPFECKLDGCDKSFTQLGNLKSHQNRFHLTTLNMLTHRLAELSGDGLNNLPRDERELLDYFKDLYKNSNKGIRGRGKQQHKEEAKLTNTNNNNNNMMMTMMMTSPNFQGSPQQQQPQQQPTEYGNQLGGTITGYQG
ncbi:Asparagine-rich zinc finger protein AZF1 [Spathaspora sp. JA1]|nr:Asparagine-rich zinc finger protein AZF1 [Spathaspora sp. JA1]